MRRGEQGCGGVRANLRRASVGTPLEGGLPCKTGWLFYAFVIEQVMCLYRKRLSLLDQAAPVRKFLCGERLSTRGNHVKPL